MCNQRHAGRNRRAGFWQVGCYAVRSDFLHWCGKGVEIGAGLPLLINVVPKIMTVSIWERTAR